MKTKKLIRLLVVTFILGVFFSGCMQSPVDITNEIKEANVPFMEAFNNADAEAMSMNYTENGKLYPANSEIIEGRENIKAFWQGGMDMGIKKVILETDYAEGFGETAIEDGSYTLYAEGDVVIDKGKYLVVWKKVEGNWKLHQDIWNTSMPLPVTETPEKPPEEEQPE